MRLRVGAPQRAGKRPTSSRVSQAAPARVGQEEAQGCCGCGADPLARRRGSLRRLCDMRQCAEDACTALGFINPGERRRGHHDGAHEVGAQGSPMHVAGRSITSRGRCSPSYKAAFSMTRTTNVHMARCCGSTEPALRKAGVRLGGHVRPLCRCESRPSP